MKGREVSFVVDHLDGSGRLFSAIGSLQFDVVVVCYEFGRHEDIAAIDQDSQAAAAEWSSFVPGTKKVIRLVCRVHTNYRSLLLGGSGFLFWREIVSPDTGIKDSERKQDDQKCSHFVRPPSTYC